MSLMPASRPGPEVDAYADRVLPAVAVQPFVGKTADDPARGNEPGPNGRMDLLAGLGRRGPVEVEPHEDLGPHRPVPIEHDAYPVRPGGTLEAVVEVQGGVPPGAGCPPARVVRRATAVASRRLLIARPPCPRAPRSLRRGRPAARSRSWRWRQPASSPPVPGGTGSAARCSRRRLVHRGAAGW